MKSQCVFLLSVLVYFVSAQELVYYPSQVEYFKSQLTPDIVNLMQYSNGSKNYHVPSRLSKREVDSTFYGHPKSQEDIWDRAFNGLKTTFDQVPSLVNLLHMLAVKHLNECVPIILYDKYVENSEGLLLQQLMQNFPNSYVHGRIGSDNSVVETKVLNSVKDQCTSYILFLADVMKSADVLGLQASSKVIVVARSSQWRVQEFLYNKASRNFVNLLVIASSFREDLNMETPYILYTHTLFVDGLGSSKPEVLTSWARGKLARPQIDLFPPKMMKGYAGHRFAVIAADQPPFVFKRITTDHLGNRRVSWEGIEYRLLNLLGHRNNFSVEIKEPEYYVLGSGEAVTKDVMAGHGDLGIAGMYVTEERLDTLDMSISHSQDCAVFISLTSTALPKYRAIMGPFHWNVWLALTFTYLFGIFPLAFSDKHTLRHLIHNTGEVENMFWYVFGTFTNCFTFVGKNSWSKTTKVTTRLLIGWYWIFTIIITACYTGSIIAFVTLPVYPATVDSVQELLEGNFRVGTLDHGGWERWFQNSSDKYTTKLLSHLELVPNIQSGLKNTTRAFFWSYAFLGSRYQLEYVVQSNFTLETSKRAVLHISDECFVPFGVSLAFPKESVYTEKLNKGISRMIQSGIISKLESDVKWDMQRSSSGKLLQVSTGGALRIASIDERGLSLSDTQGMFLLLGSGFLAAGAALLSEWLGGCGRMCRKLKTRAASSIASSISSATSRSRIAPTPQSKTDEKSEFGDSTIRNGSGSDQMIDENHENSDCKSTKSGKRSSADSEKLNEIVKECKETFRIHIEEYKEPENNENKNEISQINGQSLQVFADITHVSEETEKAGKGHSRRSSFVDWDKEINQLFSYTKSELESEDEQSKQSDDNVDENKNGCEETVVSGEEIENKNVEIVFGEKIAPVDIDDADLVEDKPNTRENEEGQ